LSNAAPIVKELIEGRAAAKTNETAWKAHVAKLTEQLAEIIGPEAILRAAEKLESGGATTTEMHGGKFTVEAEKKVSWDSKKLQDIAATLPWKQVLAIFKIKFEISETVYKSLVTNAEAGIFDIKILEKIKEARTVEIGQPKIKSAELVNPT